MFALLAVDTPVEVAEIPTVATWDQHDCKIRVTRPEGFTCKVEMQAKLDYPPEKVFDILVDPDNSRYFSNVSAVTYRKVLEDDHHGKQRVEVEQAATWRFLIFSGVFLTRLFVKQDRQEGSVEFALAKEGFMKDFTGRWEIRPFDQQTIDEISGKKSETEGVNSNYKTKANREKASSSLITLEQSILPKRTPPKFFERFLVRTCCHITKTIMEDLKGEVYRVKRGDPIPKVQIKKVKKAKRIVDKVERKKRRRKVASMSFKRIYF
eukprot:g7054.t1